MTENDLQKKIEKLEAEIRTLKKSKFGLVFEDKPEDVVEQCQKQVPVLKELKKRRLKLDEAHPNNLMIEGDNYHALYVLNYTHKGKIDVIYIDPPYNTGASDWKYNNDYVDKEDAYKHSKWLSHMSHRLWIAKSLLSPAGIMCIAIDHNELFALGCLCDKIFGENNRIGIISVEHNPQGRTFSKYVSTTNEFYLLFARNIEKCKIHNLPIEEERLADYRYRDNVSAYKRIQLRKTGFASRRKDRPTQFFPFYFDPRTNKLALDKFPRAIEIWPVNRAKEEFVWRVSFENCKKLVADNDIEVVRSNNDFTLYKKQRLATGRKPTTIWQGSQYNAAAHGAKLLKSIVKNRTFEFPKSLYAVKDAVTIMSDNRQAVVLDFFAGSGTTGHAVLKLNAEDGGSRKFILCTNNEDNKNEGGGLQRQSAIRA